MKRRNFIKLLSLIPVISTVVAKSVTDPIDSEDRVTATEVRRANAITIDREVLDKFEAEARRMGEALAVRVDQMIMEALA